MANSKSSGASAGFTEDQTKDVELSSGGGLAQDPDARANLLRGEDQLVDGDSAITDSMSGGVDSLEEE